MFYNYTNVSSSAYCCYIIIGLHIKIMWCHIITRIFVVWVAATVFLVFPNYYLELIYLSSTITVLYYTPSEFDGLCNNLYLTARNSIARQYTINELIVLEKEVNLRSSWPLLTPCRRIWIWDRNSLETGFWSFMIEEPDSHHRKSSRRAFGNL